MEGRKQRLAFLPFLLLGLLGFILPTVNSPVLASPDETAAFVTLTRFGDLKPGALAEPLAHEFPWLHPRSWVSRDQFIVPVGFLGWPWLLSFAGFLHERLAMFLATALILSSVYPLYRLLLRFGKKGAFWGSVVYMTFPPFLLYANRSLFANGAILSGVLWSVFLLERLKEKRSEKKQNALLLVAGLVIAATAAARPVEMLWIFPWLVWAGQGIRLTKKKSAWLVGGMALIIIPLAFQALVTYGNPLLSGYLISGNSNPRYELGYTEFTGPPNRDLSDVFLPYGFHPRNIWWNIRSFFLGYLLVWMIPLAVGIGVWLKRGVLIHPPKSAKALFQPIWLTAWTAFVLLSLYGSGIYADHVRVGAVTIGNSFLRYLLPVAVLIAVSLAYIYRESRDSIKMVAAVTIGCVLLAIFGVYRAVNGDDESLLATRPELERYEEVRAAAGEWFGAQDVIISERSDKIFFPEYRAVSPMPRGEEVGRLVNAKEIQVGLYVRPLSQKEKDKWRKYGVEPVELASYARERLYLLKPKQ